MPGKRHIKTFGCQMNEYDSSKMAKRFEELLGADPYRRPWASAASKPPLAFFQHGFRKRGYR